ncbi:MAG TPA: DUF4157 domain-containing protein, partial [Kofleriaceae bacterium]
MSLELLNRRDDDVAWRALARGYGVSEEVARVLWARAKDEARNDLAKADRTFRILLEEAKVVEGLASELESTDNAFDPGKWTRVLVTGQNGSAEPAPVADAVTPATRLRIALEHAARSGENAARSVVGSDAKTLTEALRRFREGQGLGSALAALDNASLSQILRLVDAMVTIVEQTAADRGKPLPSSLRADLEQKLGIDFSDVRVHDDAAAAAEASKHGAVAFARGRDVYFADGKYDPSSPDGKRLIAHEATHVAQQSGGTPAARGAMSEPGSAVELEADRVASAFARGAAAGTPVFSVQQRAAAGTISRDTGAPAGGAGGAALEWRPGLLGQTLDLSAKLSGARDVGDGKKEVDINQGVGPLKVQKATFKNNDAGDKVESGTIHASVESGVFKGTQGQLTVDQNAHVSGSLKVPVNVPGMVVKEVTVSVEPGKISGKALLDPKDFLSPDFPIKTSTFELTVSSNGTSIEAGITGSASVEIKNGMAEGAATMHMSLGVGANGVTFNATINGKVSIHGLAEANAVIKYNGEKIEFEAGGTAPVNLPGLSGTVNIQYQGGKLSLDSKDLHFTMPQLAGVKFEEVKLGGESKLGAKLSLAQPIDVPLPGGASLTLNSSSITIDGKVVNGDIAGTFKLNNAGGLSASASLAYDPTGGVSGKVTVEGGAKFSVAGVDVTINNGSTLTVDKAMGVAGDISAKVNLRGLAEVDAHLIAKKGESIDLTVDAKVDIKKIHKDLGGELKVTYRRAGGANTFALSATNVKVEKKPIGGQVVFSSLDATYQNGQFTGSLVAGSGLEVKVGSTVVTIVSGQISLLPGKILEGHLTARAKSGGSQVEATVGYKNNELDWAAEGTFDLAQITNDKLRGTVRAAAGSNGTG